MASEMVEGRAVGGPRDGIMLTASPNWDGRVQRSGKARQHNTTELQYYDGYYKWHDINGVWKWKDGELGKPKKRSSQSRAY